MRGRDSGLPRRDADAVQRVAHLFGCFGLTLAGMPPINRVISPCNADAPPADWRSQVGWWERLEPPRT